MAIIPQSLSEDGNRTFSVITQPAVEPITYTEVKEFARIDGSDEDALITSFITAARQACELFLRRALIEQTIRIRMDYWPDDEIELPSPPVISITQVGTADESDVITVYSSSNYYLIRDDMRPRIALKQSVTAPTNTEREYGGFIIDYLAGYGSTATYVPEQIKTGLKLWATDIYENRVVRETPPPEAWAVLHPYRVIRI